MDLSDATVVTLYIGQDVTNRLLSQLQKLKPGARVVSNQFAIEGVTPAKVVHFKSPEDGADHVIYLYTAPLVTK